MKKRLLILFIVVNCICFGNTYGKSFEKELNTLEVKVSKMLKDDESTLGMKRAFKFEYKELDKLLNRYYNRLKDNLGNEANDRLTSAQRKWLSYKDSQEEFFQSYASEKYGNGSLREIEVQVLMNNLIKYRTAKLVALLDGLEDVNN